MLPTIVFAQFVCTSLWFAGGTTRSLGSTGAVFGNLPFQQVALDYSGHMWELCKFWAFVPLLALPRSAFMVAVLGMGFGHGGRFAAFFGASGTVGPRPPLRVRRSCWLSAYFASISVSLQCFAALQGHVAVHYLFLLLASRVGAGGLVATRWDVAGGESSA